MWNKGRKAEVTLLLSSEMLWIWSSFISPGHGSQLVLFISSWWFYTLIKFWKMEILKSIFNTVNVRKHVHRMTFFQVFPQSTLFSLLLDTNDIFCKVAYYSSAWYCALHTEFSWSGKQMSLFWNMILGIDFADGDASWRFVQMRAAEMKLA